jgi:hypothetical protein
MIQFQNIGVNDQLPYAKADLVKASRVSDSYALSFYQLDYQALASSIVAGSALKPEQVKPIPVAKVVMNQGGFDSLLNELKQLQIAIEAQEKENAGDT